jgi:predicted PurR-regulated permease PerM
MTKQLVKIGTAVMATILALVVLWQFRNIVVYVLVSLTLATALRPLVLRLAGKGLWLRLSWVLLYLAALTGVGFLLFLTGEAALHEIQQPFTTVSRQDEWRPSSWIEDSAWGQSQFAWLPPPSKLFETLMGEQGQLEPETLLNITRSIGSVMSGVSIILLLSLYWTINQNHFERLWLSLLPSNHRIQARDIWHTIESDIGTYVRGQVIQSLLAGVLLGLGYWLLGSPFPALLALGGALACLIPMIGIVLAVIPVLLVGLLTSLQLGLLTALYTLVVLLALRIWARPQLFKCRWDNPILTLLLLIAMADAFGLIGLLAAPLLSVICQILWRRLVSRPTAAEAAAQASDLRERQQRVWEAIQGMPEPPPALVANSMERLAQLIEKAEPILQTGLPAATLPVEPSEPFPSRRPVTAAGAPAEPTKP